MAHSLLVNDPEHAPPYAPWMRGFTPIRVAAFVAICLLLAARPALWNARQDQVAEALWRLGFHWTRWFLFGLPLFVLLIKADQWTAHARPLARLAAFSAAVVVGAAALSTMIWGLSLPLEFDGRWQWQAAFLVRGLTMGSLMAAILYFTRRERDTQRELHRAKLSQVDNEKRATESKLRLLHAQIEPHFLFNSLASIKRLYERDPGSGRAMLRNLCAYVARATARAGEPVSRLGDEIQLAKSYLEMLEIRMGNRLRVRIDVPSHLDRALVPSLAIGTLVENAIKHGIAPRASGGTIEVSARIAERELRVEVRDDGVGFRARSGPGIGLANVRARLEGMFQGAASLELSANREGGVTASLSLPCRFG